MVLMMKKIIFILFIYILASNIALAYKSPDDFRGIVWGEHFDKIKNIMNIREDGGDNKFYTRDDDVFKVGEADLKNIIYAFYKNEFYSVIVQYEGNSNHRIIKDVLFQKYGEGNKSNNFMDYYSWGLSAMSADFVYIVLEYNEVTNNGQLTYVYKPISDQIDKEEHSKNKEAAKDL